MNSMHSSPVPFPPFLLFLIPPCLYQIFIKYLIYVSDTGNGFCSQNSYNLVQNVDRKTVNQNYRVAGFCLQRIVTRRA